MNVFSIFFFTLLNIYCSNEIHLFNYIKVNKNEKFFINSDLNKLPNKIINNDKFQT